MDLTHHQRRVLELMPDLSFGIDQDAYVRSCMSWAREEGHNTVEVLQLARMKWRSWEVERLIVEIEDGSQEALQRGVTMLLKKNYIV